MNATFLRTPHFLWLLALASVLAYSLVAPQQHYKIREVSPVEARDLIDSGALVIDVREHADLRLPGAMLIPQAALEASLANLDVAKTAKIVVYCGDGSTSGPSATDALNRAGYANAVNLKSGFQGWKAAGLPTVKG